MTPDFSAGGFHGFCRVPLACREKVMKSIRGAGPSGPSVGDHLAADGTRSRRWLVPCDHGAVRCIGIVRRKPTPFGTMRFLQVQHPGVDVTHAG